MGRNHLLEISVASPRREVMVDITERVQTALSDGHPGLTGIVHVFVPHTTAAITINEGADAAVLRDVIGHLGRLVPRDSGFEHSEGNSDAHIKASLVGSSVLAPVEQGRLRLGTWQSIYLVEFDGPRNRRVWLTPIAFAEQGGAE